MSAKGRLYMHSMKVWLSIIVLLISATIAFAQTEVSIQSLNSTLFPFIYANVSVRSDGTPVLNLTKEDFEVFENNTLQTDNFEVTPPQSAGGVRLADIVFLIDCSGSMGGEISDVRNNVINFANALETSNIDYRLGLVRFGWNDGGYPYLFNNGNLTADADQFKGFVSSLSADGSYEPGLLAIQQAITGFNFRPGSQKIFLIISDEDSDEGNKQTTMDMLLANSITVHSAVLCSAGSSQSHYCDETSVSGVTGGLLFDVSSSYNQILDTIVEQTSSSYVIRYKSSNPVLDATVRNVEIFTTAGSQPDSDVTIYIPGAAPNIILTEATQNLFAKAPPEGYNVTISATITDSSSPYVSSARLYYRPILGIYQSVEMVNTQGDTWASDILGSIMSSPGVEFYITATDGQTNVSLPKTDPSDQPYSIAVLPNELPQIIHIPPFSATVGQDITINATITDTTHNLQSVKLFYRKLGEIQYTELGVSVGLQSFDFSEIIPGSSVTSYGVEYYIEATDDLGAKNTHGTPDKPNLIGVGFVWQRIQIEGETYSVIVRADGIPTNPEKFAYPIYDSSVSTELEPKAIGIVNTEGKAVTDLFIQKRVLSYARNAALYRILSDKENDPISTLIGYLNFFKADFTPVGKYCFLGPIGCKDYGGGTVTSFGYTYPGSLIFPDEFSEQYGTTRMVDWDFEWPLLGGSYLHPKGLKFYQERKSIYNTLLKHIMLQDGIVAMEQESAENMLSLLQELENRLRIENDIETATLVDNIVSTVFSTPGATEIAFRSTMNTISSAGLHFNKAQMASISKALHAQNHYTGWAAKVAPTIGFLLEAGLTKWKWDLQFEQDQLIATIRSMAMAEHGLSILASIESELFESYAGYDSAFVDAFYLLKNEFSELTIEQFYVKFFEELSKAKEVGKAIDSAQLLAAGAAAIFAVIPGGQPVAIAIGCIKIGISLIQIGVEHLIEKYENEEYQQAAVLCSTLEYQWWENPIKSDAISKIPSQGVTDSKDIDTLNWLVSSKIFQGIFAADKLLIEKSDYTNDLKDYYGDNYIKTMQSYLGEHRNRLIRGFFGEGQTLYTTLDRFAGTQTKDGKYIGFVRERELDELLALTNDPDKAITDYKLDVRLFSPGIVGLTDPAGRRIGTFYAGTKDGVDFFIDINEIPGATYNGQASHPKSIIISKPLKGSYDIELTGTGTGEYTLKAIKLSQSDQILDEIETNGYFEIGRQEDGEISVGKTLVSLSSPPKPRSLISGLVTDAVSHKPIKNTKITLGNSTSFTGDNGAYEFKNVVPGEITIKIISEGYQAISEEISVLSGVSSVENFELSQVVTYFLDNDKDGFGDSNIFIQSLAQPSGYVENNIDCNDYNADIFPAAPEICDGIDNNCDREIDEGDVCEAADSDGDGVPDAADNCPNTANAGQEDMDGDGIGDACEAPIADSDGDGVPDATDNCPNTTNVGQKDTDGDGTGDACDEGGGGGGGGGGCFIGSLTASI